MPGSHGRGGDNGMFAVAFHPQFKSNGEFFVVYTTQAAPKSTVVSRFRISDSDPNQANADSEEEILRIRQPWADHNAACVAFGPDNMLYIALGDGGYNTANGNAQDTSTLLGSMLRIDVDHRENGKAYSIPKDNPFVANATGTKDAARARHEIWCYGLRAPWRFSFDRVTGDCWLGDNGQVEFEEVNLILPGKNYGWMPREGFHAFDLSNVDPRGRPAPGPIPQRDPETGRTDGFTDPILEYEHTQGKSVVGGIVYWGHQLPQLIGAYIYGDYANGNIWALRRDGGKVVENKLIARTRLKIKSFGEDQAGEMYFTSFDGFVYRLRPAEQPTIRQRFPATLSETGLFESVRNLIPVGGLIPYSVNVPLWSDHALKQRHIALPAAGRVEFSENGHWLFPVGTVFVKTFLLETHRGNPATRQRLETRLLVHNPRSWAGYTYRWNREQTEALLLGGAASSTLEITTTRGVKEQSWYFPSGSDCMACHTRASGFVLGMNTRQMNREHDYGSGATNQLTAFQHGGVFHNTIPAAAEQLPAWHDWASQSGSLCGR